MVEPAGCQCQVSVVIPCFNNEDTIQRAISSVDTEASVLEVIVSDDGSSDASVDLALATGVKTKVLRGKNRGASHARNQGLAVATGEYVLFLDADDYVESGFIDSLALHCAEGIDLVIGGHRHIDEDGETIRIVKYRSIDNQVQLLEQYLHYPVQTGAFLWKREWIENAGGWDESISIFQDAEIAIRMILRQPRFVVSDDASHLAVWQEHSRPTRITNSFNAHKAESTLRSLKKHTDAVCASNSERARNGLALRYYALARRAFGAGHDDVGRAALMYARQQNLRGHPGSIAHKLVCSVIGLRNKVQFRNAFVGISARIHESLDLILAGSIGRISSRLSNK